MMSNLPFRRKLALNIKNLPGWRTKRKIVVFSIDDYGNVHMASKQAREALLSNKKLNLQVTRFTKYDALETVEDLQALFEVLTSIKDKNNNHPAITAFAMPCNIDFEKVIESNYTKYYYEKLPATFNKLSGKDYNGVWELWKQGIEAGIFIPEFHGREHLNVNLFESLLQIKHQGLIANIKNRSYAGLTHDLSQRVGFTEAFSFDDIDDLTLHKEIIIDGLNQFEQVFGVRATHFNAPGAREHRFLEKVLAENGIKYLDTDFIKKEYQGDGKYSSRVHRLGQQSHEGLTYMIRNCVLEPLIGHGYETTLQEIAIAFKRNKPANISSHRVNFCGKIDDKIRRKGLSELELLLKAIVRKWPDVEFMTTKELGSLIHSELKVSNREGCVI